MAGAPKMSFNNYSAPVTHRPGAPELKEPKITFINHYFYKT
jgi:hypothetical protein